MLRVLRDHPDFRRLWLAQVISQAGDWLNRVAVLALIGELGGAEAAAGVGALFGLELALRLVPGGVFGPLAGPAADRLPRRAVMVVTDLLRALVVLGMLTIDRPEELPRLYALLLAQSTLAVFFNTARAGALPSTVSGPDLHLANALSSATWSVMLALGTSLGGLLMLALDLRGIFWLDATSYLVSAALLARLRLPPVGRHSEPFRWRDALLFVELRRGLAHARERGFAPALLAKTLWGPGGGYLVLLSVLASTRFAGGDLARAGFATGMLYAARGVGTGLGPILGRRWFGEEDHHLARQVAGGYLVAALGYAAVPLAGCLGAACALVALAHLGGSSIWVASTTLWQRHAAHEFRGRVHALETLGMTLAFSLGGFLAGELFDLRGDADLVLWSASGAVVVCGAAWAMAARDLLRGPA
jgi:MFS family permease